MNIPQVGSSRPGHLAVAMIGVSMLALLIYAVLRAAQTSFTWDESHSFIYHVIPKVFFPVDFGQMGANHHLLNVWGMIAANQFLGNSELALRLPSLLAYVIYLYATARIALQARSSAVVLAVFLLLNLHPYLIDFFTLARGYGPGIGWMMLSLWSGSCYIRNGQEWLDIAVATLAAILAAMANLVMLNFLVAYTVAMLLFMMLLSARHRAPFRWRHAVGILLGVLLALSLLVPIAWKLSMGGALYFGSDQFWEGTMGSLAVQFLYGCSYGLPDRVIMWVALALLLICCVVVLVAALRKHWSVRLLPMIFGGAILMVCLGAMVAQHAWLGTPYPRARTALHLVPLVLFVLVSGLLAWPGRTAVPAFMAGIFCVPLLVHFLKSAGLPYTMEWRPAGEVAQMMRMVQSDHARRGPLRPVIMVASDLESRGSLSYYAIRYAMPWVVPVPHDGPGAFHPSDYYIVEQNSRGLVDTAHWELVYRSTTTGTDLFRDKRWRSDPRVVHHEKLDMEGPETSGRVADQAYSGNYSVRFDEHTRGTEWIHWTNPTYLSAANLRVLGTARVKQPNNSNWVSLVVRVTRGAEQIAYVDAGSAMQMERFGEWQLVGLSLNLVRPLLSGDVVHLEAPPYAANTEMHLDDLELWILE